MIAMMLSPYAIPMLRVSESPHLDLGRFTHAASFQTGFVGAVVHQIGAGMCPERKDE
jgi:hypothetical protein